MMPKKEDIIHTSTISIGLHQPMSRLSIQERDEESKSPLMLDQTTSSSISSSSSHSNRSLPFSLRSPGSQSPPLSPVGGSRIFGGSDHRNSSGATRKRAIGGEYELKNSHDALTGSISAVINFLLTSGVPKPACEQLQKNLEMGRYFAVMKRVQDYIQCLPSPEEDQIMAKLHLSVTAWEALCRFKTIEYKRAYKWCFYLRYECQGRAAPAQAEIQSAIALQVQLAEQCTTCQKKLYLVQKWQRHLLQKMKRSTMIEPAGFQPIRCL